MKFTILEKNKGEADDTTTKISCDTTDLMFRGGGSGRKFEYYPMPDNPTVEELENYARRMMIGFNIYARATNQTERELVGVTIDD